MNFFITTLQKLVIVTHLISTRNIYSKFKNSFFFYIYQPAGISDYFFDELSEFIQPVLDSTQLRVLYLGELLKIENFCLYDAQTHVSHPVTQLFYVQQCLSESLFEKNKLFFNDLKKCQIEYI